MNKTLAIAAIVLVAVVMGMSTIAPAMAWEAETDGGKDKACDALFAAIAKGASVSPKAIAKVCTG